MNIKKFLATFLSAAVVCTSLPLRSDVKASGTDNLSPGAKVGIGLGSGAVFAAGAGALIWSLLRGHPFGSSSVAPQPSGGSKDLNHDIALGYGTLQWRKFDQPKSIPEQPAGTYLSSYAPSTWYFRATKTTGAVQVEPQGWEVWRLIYKNMAFVADELNDRFIEQGLPLFTGVYDFKDNYNGEKILENQEPTREADANSYICDKQFDTISGALEYLKSLFPGDPDPKLAVLDSGNNSFRTGDSTGSHTLEENMFRQCTGGAAVRGSFMNESFAESGSMKNSNIPFRFSIVDGARFYPSTALQRVYDFSFGINPAYISANSAAIERLYNIMIKALIFVTAFNKNQKVTEQVFRLWARNIILMLKKLGIKGIVITKAGAGSYKATEKKWYEAKGWFEDEWYKHAPKGAKAVVFDAPSVKYDCQQEYTDAISNNFRLLRRGEFVCGWSK